MSKQPTALERLAMKWEARRAARAEGSVVPPKPERRGVPLENPRSTKKAGEDSSSDSSSSSDEDDDDSDSSSSSSSSSSSGSSDSDESSSSSSSSSVDSSASGSKPRKAGKHKRK